MLFNKKINWNLLAKYVAGEANVEEAGAIKAWAAKNSDNLALLQDVKNDWKKMDTMNARFNVDNAWDKLNDRIGAGKPADKEEPVKKQRRLLRGYFNIPMQIAASVIFLVILGLAISSVTGSLQKVEVIAALNETGKVIELPDGSMVTLNGNTKLSYTKSFGKRQRKVMLDGEAFFNVSADKSKPFRIFAGNACVKVLGTSFNVNSRKNLNQVEVYVASGVVELSEIENQNNRVVLHKGNIGLIDNKDILLENAENANSIAWKTNALTFHGTRLTEVIQVLNEMYHVKIIINDPGVDKQQISGSYQGDPLNEILEVICLQNHLSIAKSADTIYLSR